MPQITLPDGSSRSFDNPVTVLDVAADRNISALHSAAFTNGKAGDAQSTAAPT